MTKDRDGKVLYVEEAALEIVDKETGAVFKAKDGEDFIEFPGFRGDYNVFISIKGGSQQPLQGVKFLLNGSPKNFLGIYDPEASFTITDDTLNDGEILQLSSFYGGNDVIAKLKITRKKAADNSSLHIETYSKKEKIDSLVFLELDKNTIIPFSYRVLLDEKFDLVVDVISEDEENVKVKKYSNTVLITHEDGSQEVREENNKFLGFYIKFSEGLKKGEYPIFFISKNGAKIKKNIQVLSVDDVWEFIVLDKEGKEKEKLNFIVSGGYYRADCFRCKDDKYSLKIIDKRTNQQIKLMTPEEFVRADLKFLTSGVTKFFLDFEGKKINFQVGDIYGLSF